MENYIIILFAGIGIIYSLLILYLIFGFGKIKDFNASEAGTEISFSIIIPFRNEAENLPQLFQTLEQLIYPKNLFEIILIDDDSSDNSVAICEEFQKKNSDLEVLILQNEKPQLAKKAAITTGIHKSSKNYIATTDADCLLPKYWLQGFDRFIQQSNAKLIAGPVIFSEEKSFLNIFQNIDFMSLQAATIGGFGIENPFLCNAANLCYERKAFFKMNGFSGNEQIASGDDIFLLQKLKTANLKVKFLKSRKSIVVTKAVEDFRSLLNQRVRWAAKTSAYKSTFGKFVGLSVFAMNFALVVSAALVLLNILPDQILFILFLFKFNLDFILIYRVAIFFQREKLLKNYFWCSFIYPFFSCFVALKSIFSGYYWKDRKFLR